MQLVQQAQLRGAELDALQLGDELERRGHSVRTVYLYHRGETPQQLRRQRDVYLAGAYDSVLERFPGWHPALLRRLRRAAEEFDPQVIQAGGGRTVKYGALLRNSKPGRRLVWRNIGEIDRWLTGSLRLAYYRRMVLPRIDAVVSMTGTGAAAFRALLGDSVSIVQLPPGIDPDTLAAGGDPAEIRTSLDVPAQAPFLLAIGALSEEKRLDVALEAVAHVRREFPEAVLCIAGDGPERARLQSQAGNAGLGTAVHFLGARDDIGDLLAAADLLVISSDTEGLPRALLEAALTGTPVVSTAVGGIPDVISHGKTGLLSNPGDAEALARNCIAVLREPARAAAIAEAARLWAQDNATLQTVTSRYEDLYRSLFGAA